MIVTVGGFKAGSGKTTVATNLVILRSRAGRKVLLIDADHFETASNFTAVRNEAREGGAGYTSIPLSGAAIQTEVPRLGREYKDVFIDIGGRDTASQRAAVSVSDVLLVPCLFEVETIEKVTALIGEMQAVNPGIRAYIFLNHSIPVGTLSRNYEGMADALSENGLLHFANTPLSRREVFIDAAAEGFAVTEMVPPDPIATGEIMALYRYVFTN